MFITVETHIMDDLTPEQRHKSMSHIRSKDTKIEIRLRLALWHEGIRYRKNYKALPGKPDIAIIKHKIAVFCDSGFWHGRDFETRKKPVTNAEYWNKKIQRNMERDREVDRMLRSMDWTVLRFWDKDIEKDLEGCVKAVWEAIMDASIMKKEPVDFNDKEINNKGYI